MKNVIFISPNYPSNYWNFCMELKRNGLNVLGIGDQPHYELRQEQKDSLTEYYKVSTLNNYEEVFRAVAFFTYKYGKIDFLESNNEFWLEQDAKLRTEYNIPGLHVEDMQKVKYKSKMKEYYQKAGIATARHSMVDSWENAMGFIKTVGYPVVVKPDSGLESYHVYRIDCEDDLKEFFDMKAKEVKDTSYIMEEYIKAAMVAYDAIIGKEGKILFETGSVALDSTIDIIANKKESSCYVMKETPQSLLDAGRATVASFEIENRYIHLEYFLLDEDYEGLGAKGDLVGLEVNMRPPSGFLPDMMNYAHYTNVYKIWADMVAFGETSVGFGGHQFCGLAGRREGKNYAYDMHKILHLYGTKVKGVERVEHTISILAGNIVCLAVFDREDEMMNFFRDMALLS